MMSAIFGADYHTTTREGRVRLDRDVRSDPFYIDVFSEIPGLLDTSEERGINALLDLYAQDVREVANDKNVALIDVFKVFEDYGKQSGMSINDLLLEGDGIHPNTAGPKPDFNQRI